MTGLIRPAGKKDVTVTVDGLDFNTPDSFIIDYLNKFGVVLSNNVVYTKYDSGPFKGKFNGERKYQVDFSKSNRQMGTYHIIDGSKVRIFYRGNKKTCGHCHKVAAICPGEAVAKNCAAGGGTRVFLSDHMREVWNEVGFVPVTFELDEDDKTEDDIQQAARDAPVLNNSKLPTTIERPEPESRDIEQFNGVSVKNFPTKLDEKEILTFLINYGLPTTHDSVHININKEGKSTGVIIDDLGTTAVQTLYNSIHFPVTKQKFFDVPLYCKPIRNMTPTKVVSSKDVEEHDGIINEADGKEVEEHDDITNEADNREGEEQDDQEHDDITYEADNKEVKDFNEIKNTETNAVKPTIPGLPEEERLKKKKKRKRKSKNKEEKEKSTSLPSTDLLISPESGLLKENDIIEREFQFSGYEDNDDSESDVSNDAFEDSKETLNDGKPEDFMTPASPKSNFVKNLDFAKKNLVAKSDTKPLSSVKRSAGSPLGDNDSKKSRARQQSMLTKKK